MKKYIIAGGTGGIVVSLLLLLASHAFDSFHYKSIFIINPQKIIDSTTGGGDNLTCAHIKILKDLEDKGLLMTPSEYTSHISSFYSTFVTFLIGLFVLFTMGGNL